jgi:glycosyltransferase involved in cell wall biosynthesis
MIFIVSTKVQSGKGGISTALAAYKTAKHLLDSDIDFVTSHDQNRSRLKTFFHAWRYLHINVKQGDIVWLHCGSWFSILRKFLLSIPAKLRGGKVVFHFHGNSILALNKHPVSNLLLSLLFRFANGVVVLSPWWKRFFLKHYPVVESKIAVCPNVLSDNTKAVRADSFNANKTIRLLAMSRLITGKGFEAAIESLCSLPANYTLSIAGEGPIQEELEKLIIMRGLQNRVSFLGWVDFSHKADLFSHHDIFVLPSQNDSFGMVFLEAMAAGLPVVALKYNAIEDVVPDGEAGILCENNSPETISQAIQSCVKNWHAYHIAAHKHTVLTFDKDKITHDIVKFFESL